MLAGGISINQIAIFSKAKARWIKHLIPINTIPSMEFISGHSFVFKPEFLKLLFMSSWKLFLMD